MDIGIISAKVGGLNIDIDSWQMKIIKQNRSKHSILLINFNFNFRVKYHQCLKFKYYCNTTNIKYTNKKNILVQKIQELKNKQRCFLPML